MNAKAKPKLQRVRKENVLKESFERPDPLDICLHCWKNWMAGDSDKDLGAKTLRMLSGDADAYGVDASEEQQKRDNEIGAATDAMIDSLSMLHRWAIYEVCGLPTVWKYPNADILTVGIAARDALTTKLKKNICTSSLF